MNKRLRHTDKQSDTKTNKQRNTQIKRETHAYTYTHRLRQENRHTDRQTDTGRIKETLTCNYYLDGCDDGLDDG